MHSILVNLFQIMDGAASIGVEADIVVVDAMDGGFGGGLGGSLGGNGASDLLSTPLFDWLVVDMVVRRERENEKK